MNEAEELGKLIDDIIHIGYVRGNHEMGGVYNHIEPYRPEEMLQRLQTYISDNYVRRDGVAHLEAKRSDGVAQLPTPTAKFIQIAVDSHPDVVNGLYALDESGQVWMLEVGVWVEIVTKRFISPPKPNVSTEVKSRKGKP